MKGYSTKQILIASCLYLGQILTGYSAAWSAPVILKLQDPNHTPLPEVLTDGQISWLGSVIFIGIIIGPFISSHLSNAKGRKSALLLGVTITMTSFLLLVSPFNYAMLLAGRIINGLGLGINAITSLVYLGEIASTNMRGIILTGSLLTSSLGSLAVYSIVPYVSYGVSIYIAIAITIFYTVGIFSVPESPVYHVLKGDDKEAFITLVSLGRPNDIEGIIKAKAELDQTKKNDWIQVFTVKCNRKALFITLTLCILQAFSGVYALGFFTNTIFDLVGSTIDPNISTIITGATKVISSCITPFLVERAGRRILLIFSTAFCSLCLAVLGTFFYLDKNYHSLASQLYWLPLATLVIFFLCHNLGFAIVPDILIGEMFVSNVRSIGATITITTGWIFGFIVTSTFMYMVSGLGSDVTFWIFSGSCALAFMFSVIFVPETKGKSLYEIQNMLSK